jgi:twinkle protein
VPPRHLLAIMRYCAVELECRHFILDNLTMILSADNDKAADHQSFVADCMTIAKTTGLHIHLVAHCHKPENGDESRIPTGYNARGTGTAPDMVDNILVVWRNKPKEFKISEDRADDDVRKQPDVKVMVDKQRHWDFRGALNYWIDRGIMRFMEYGHVESAPFL